MKPLSLQIPSHLLSIAATLSPSAMVAGIVPLSVMAAPAYKSLRDFGAYPEGASPINGVTVANDGNYYCATQEGGQFGLGGIVRMTPAGVSSLMYSFKSQSGRGANSKLVTTCPA